MAPPKNDDDQNGWREYRISVVETLDFLRKEVRLLHDEVLVIKTRIAVISILFGGLGSIIGGVAMTWINKSIH